MRFKKLPGFTMIELLVVIAVIGILAVALLASLNPLEQIRKGRDTRTRSDSSQLASALERYNASLGYFPWQASEGEDLSPAGADLDFIQVNTTTAITGCSLTPCTIDVVMQSLTDTNEVKSSFIDKITATSYADTFLYYNDEDTGASVHVCFIPESNSFAKEAFDRCKAGAASWGSDFSPAVYNQASRPCPDGDATAYASATFNSSDPDEMICIP